MLPKVVFGITVLAIFKINNNFKQNIDETDSKQPKIHKKIHKKIHTSLWILEIPHKINLQTESLETFAKCLWFPKRKVKPYPLGSGFKNL